MNRRSQLPTALGIPPGASSSETDKPDQPIAAPFDSVMEVIARGLRKDWNSADNEGVPYESSEGGYQYETTDTYDVVHNEVPVDNQEFLNDVIQSLDYKEWCPRDFARLSPRQELSFDWEYFCDLVKHKNRYMFNLKYDVMEDYEPDLITHPARILNQLGRIYQKSIRRGLTEQAMCWGRPMRSGRWISFMTLWQAAGTCAC
jgi:hypothetical protein